MGDQKTWISNTFYNKILTDENMMETIQHAEVLSVSFLL